MFLHTASEATTESSALRVGHIVQNIVVMHCLYPVEQYQLYAPASHSPVAMGEIYLDLANKIQVSFAKCGEHCFLT